LDWTTAGVDENAGGAGGDLADVVELAAGIGRHAVRLPVWQTGIAAWALAECGLSPELTLEGAVVVRTAVTATERDGRRVISCAAAGIPWLSAVPTAVVVGDDGTVDVIDLVDATLSPRQATFADEPIADLVVARVAPGASGRGAPDLAVALATRELICRAAAMAGAVERVCALTLEHVQTRQQFGKPLMALQSVAHVIADMIVERDRLNGAVQELILRPEREMAAVAVATACLAASVVSAGAHQLHGAIGITEEHVLHQFTKRLCAWRDAEPSARALELELGGRVLAGADDSALWALVTSSQLSTPPSRREVSAARYERTTP
ncbi:MAG: acyl-CoA dehydrogenase family protein, partial [Marmoricola sp.]